ncbi:MAG: hypothetical protein ABR562_07870 [Thermoplasmatota archaeon]
MADTLSEYPWIYAAAGAGFLLPPAIALAIVAASANKLWHAIYREKGEAWPWRGAEPETEIPVSP